MPWKDAQAATEFFKLVLAFAAMISGGAGGALVAATYVLRRKVDTLAMASAYVVVGTCMGFGIAVVSPVLPGLAINNISDALLLGFLAGLVGSVSLAASHVILRFSAKRLGIEHASVEIKFRDDGAWRGERAADEREQAARDQPAQDPPQDPQK